MALNPFLNQSIDAGDGLPMPVLKAGQVLFNGRYELLHALGAGGMGVVWLTRDHTEHAEVALKFLPSVLVLQESEMRRLREEVRAGKELRHPRIVATYALEVQDGTAAIVMEYVKGRTLKELLEAQERGFFEPAELAAWAKDVGEAITYLHSEARRIHRDLKPANIIVDEAGRARLMDFGISRRIQEGASRHSKTGDRQSGGSSNTLAYASPQQLAGNPAAFADDIYGFGATLYEMLSGLPPFFRGDADIVRGQIKHEPVTSLAVRRQELVDEGLNASTGEPVPAAVEQMLQACLAKEREARPTSAAQVAECLNAPAAVEQQPEPLRQSAPDSAAAPEEIESAGGDIFFEPAEAEEPAAPRSAAILEANYGVWLGSGAAAAKETTAEPTPVAPAADAALNAPASPLTKIRRTQTATAEERQWGPPSSQREDEGPAAQRSPWLRLLIALTVMSLAAAAVCGVWTLVKPKLLGDTSAVTQSQSAKNASVKAEVRKPNEVRPSEPNKSPAQPAPPPQRVDALYEVTSNVADAEVWADKKKIGITPLKFALAPGTHDLIVRTADGTPQRFTVRVSDKGIASPSSYRAVFHGGGVHVESTPPGAECRLSNDWVAYKLTTPGTLSSLAAGTWKATFTLAGCLPMEKQVEVKDGETARLSVSLSPASSTVLWNLTKEAPYTNSLGMKFVPIGVYRRKDGTVSRKVHFCIWETRSRDFAAFVKAIGYDAGKDWQTFESHGWPVGRGRDEPVEVSNHPVANMRYEDATAFCIWLTNKERASGRIGPNDEYRLPTDVEWSLAADIGDKEDSSAAPRLKDMKVKDIYPWGLNYPPPASGGNYADASYKSRLAGNEGIPDYVDGYATTAPVGSFKPNSNGLYDMGGNLWEWTSTLWEPGSQNYVLRGASWVNASPSMMLSSYRRADRNTLYASGFRCVLKVEAPPVPVLEITLKPDAANPLAYDTRKISAQAGQKVRLTFSNTPSTQQLPHNVVIGKAGTKDKMMDIAKSAMTMVNTGYIPESTDILAHTSLVQPGKSETIEFTLPAAGEYPYFCTFPGHVAIMNGVITVQ